MSKALKELFFIEVIDVYGGEANYLRVTRHIVRAKHSARRRESLFQNVCYRMALRRYQVREQVRRYVLFHRFLRGGESQQFF